MEKYSRQALAEGAKNVTDLVVSTDCELYRVLVLHYNRNNQLEVRLPRTLCCLVAQWLGRWIRDREVVRSTPGGCVSE